MSMRKRGVKVVWYWQKCWCWPALSLTLVSVSSSVLPCHEPEQILHLTRCKQATPTELNCELLSTKKSKAYLQFHFLTLPLKFGEFPLGLSQICARLWVFSNYHFRNHLQSLCNHQHHTYTILPSFLIFVLWLLGIFCFCRSNISPACRAHGENTLSTCSVWTTTPNTSVERDIDFSFENLTS